MGLILGYISLICFILLALKFVSRKFGLKKLNTTLMKIHKPVSVVLIVAMVLHFAFVIPVLSGRSIWVNITGVICIIAMVLQIISSHTIKERNVRMKWHRIATVFIIFILLLHIIFYLIDFFAYQNNIKSIVLKSVDFSTLSDGEYIGEYDAGYVYAKVEVTIKNGKVENIEILKHITERGKKAEVIVNNIVEKQTLEVDAISSATNSSKVIKKAVENAVSTND